MSAADVEVVSEMLEAFNRQDYDRSMALLHDDIELHQWTAIPDSDTYVGKEKFLSGLALWLSSFERGFQYEPEELTDHGDTVLVKIMLRGVGRGSGVKLEQRVFQVYEVKDGQIISIKVFDEEAEALEAIRAEA